MVDVIVIGAGLNGLVAANYMTKAGKKVLERRSQQNKICAFLRHCRLPVVSGQTESYGRQYWHQGYDGRSGK